MRAVLLLYRSAIRRATQAAIRSHLRATAATFQQFRHNRPKRVSVQLDEFLRRSTIDHRADPRVPERKRLTPVRRRFVMLQFQAVGGAIRLQGIGR